MVVRYAFVFCCSKVVKSDRVVTWLGPVKVLRGSVEVANNIYWVGFKCCKAVRVVGCGVEARRSVVAL